MVTDHLNALLQNVGPYVVLSKKPPFCVIKVIIGNS